jgi:hypothetical protein
MDNATSAGDDNFLIGQYLFFPRELSKNKLIYRYKNTKRKVKGLSEYEITNKVRNIILNFHNKKTLNQNTYDGLNDDEKSTLDQFVVLTRLGTKNKSMVHAVSKLDADINRFNIIRGELMAGNTSPLLITELKLTVLKLAKNNLISATDSANLLYLLCTV